MTVNKKWKNGDNICPICLDAVEDWQHVLTCKSDDLTRTQEDFVTEFRKLLKEHKTYPPLRNFFVDSVR